MKNVKFIIGSALILGICFLCLPAKSVAESDDSVVLPERSESESIESSASGLGFDDKAILVYPNNNCDPEFLIHRSPNIDPGFLIKDWPSSK